MFRGIDVDINFNVSDCDEDIKQNIFDSRACSYFWIIIVVPFLRVSCFCVNIFALFMLFSIFVRSHEEKRSAYAPQFGVRKRRSEGGRTLRAQKNVMKCPSCSIDIAEFLQNPEVNRHMMSAIETLLREAEIEESSEVSNDKNNENIETVNDDDGTEVSKHCDSGENVLEEIKDNDLNQPHKRRKGTGDSAIVNSEEQIDVAID
ncbi:uncharacterized protein [Arachis hypogaea]|uniref:uncharacterized protein n=2 Tax=Arachis TaxID=3817 RepID=UPI003B21CA70